MKPVTTETSDVWLSGDYTGMNRPMVRATIQQWWMFHSHYRARYDFSSTWVHNGKYRSALFNQKGPIRELRNIKSIKYSRGIDTDVATCTIVLYNVHWKGDDNNTNPEEFDFPGWFTPNRGDFDRWDYASNRWKDWLLPDRIIKTWEGYGVTPEEVPEADPKMYPSGVWLIDTVAMSTDGLITLTCRDLGRLLLDQIMFPPIVPRNAYPLWFEAKKTVPKDQIVEAAGDWLTPTYEKDSNDLVRIAGLQDGSNPAVASDGTVHNHEGAMAVDSDADAAHSFWLSAGSSDPGQLEWIQFTVPDTPVSGVKVNVKGGPYKFYVSLYVTGHGWVGAAKIPYKIAADGTDLGADIPFAEWYHIGEGDNQQFEIGRKNWDHVTKIRLTFASHWDSGIGKERVYRSALQNFKYCTETVMVDAPEGETKVTGNYGDYTHIIKWLCAWGGFHWPQTAKMKRLDGDVNMYPTVTENQIRKGAVWGDFGRTAVTGILKLDESMWDKKPLMDGINAIREIVGFDFWIDESGGAVWRMPNVWTKGNYVMPLAGGGERSRTGTVIEVDERTTLIDLEVVLSSANVRERVFVADVNGNYGTVVHGFNPAPAGMMRVGGWTDQHFKSRAETARMADLIAIRQSYRYRSNTITIAANPAIQIDDQIIIYERMTGEGFLHRVLNIDSDFDFESGKWTYTLQTQWLGDAAFTELAWNPVKLKQATQQYLTELGFIGGGGGGGGGGA